MVNQLYEEKLHSIQFNVDTYLIYKLDIKLETKLMLWLNQINIHYRRYN